MATDHRVLNAEPLGDGGPGVEVERETLVRKQVDKEKRKWKIDPMPREARLDVPGGLHHITILGIEYRKIFINEASWCRVLDRKERSYCP
jgi:hypothetical protein